MSRRKISLLAIFYIYLLSIGSVNGKFPAILAFGDSILDTGNNNRLLTLMKGNVPPFGRSNTMRLPTGRFGNGRVFSDIVAEGLGIKKKLPAYRKFLTSPGELKTGVCFASGGAGIDPITSRTLRVLTPAQQVSDFKGYVRKLKMVAGSAQAKSIVSNAVILVSQGNNDIGVIYFPTALFRGMTPSRYTTKLANWNKQFIKNLYNAGGRKFAIMSTLPIGCLPGGIRFGRCSAMANRVASTYNSKLKSGVQTWGKEAGFRGARFVYVDMYNSLLSVINNYRRHGFSNAKRGCYFCLRPDSYVFFDFAHPSEKSYKIIAKTLVPKIRAGLA